MFPLLELLASVEMQLIFGIASGVLSIFAFVPYILDTIARRTEPQRASWLIWAVLGSIAFMSQVFEGATSSLWFAGVQVASTIIILVLSIWVGTGKFLGKSDYMILVAASIGLLLWYFTDNAAYALAITISISLLGGMATIVKAYRDPESETLITWVVSLAASVCAILSVGVVGSYPVGLSAIPVYPLSGFYCCHRIRPSTRQSECERDDCDNTCKNINAHLILRSAFLRFTCNGKCGYCERSVCFCI